MFFQIIFMITIAIIGRTNVGKSTLFNRIIGRAKVLTSELPHTTRDQNAGETVWRGVTIRCIDTGGVEEVRSKKLEVKSIEEEIQRQAARAAHDADIIVFVTDARDGILPDDRTIARDLRQLGKPIVIACNKAETKRLRDSCLECSSFGLGDITAVSAVTGMGVGDLLDRIIESHKPEAVSSKPLDDGQLTAYSLSRRRARDTGSTGIEPVSERGVEVSSEAKIQLTTPIRVAIVGEPNVGKSSLVNAILGREEVIVHPEPFTTRDVHDVDLEVDGQRITLLDTAGIRRLAVRAVKTSRTRLDAIERQAVKRGLAAIERSDVIVLVLDATRMASRHTKQLATTIVDDGRACVIVVNKMDLVPPTDRALLTESVHHQFARLDWAPVIGTIALKHLGAECVLPAAIRAATAWRRTITADQLAAIHALVKRRIPAARTRIGKRRSNVVELTQTGITPPTFLLRTRQRVILPKAIPAIVERAIRESENFTGTPIRIAVKSVKG